MMLGPANSFRSVMNAELGATVVELERDGERRVLLLRARADGQPVVEDLRATLADAAGRGPLGGIEGLSVDLGAFAEQGTIGVGEAAGDGFAEGEGARGGEPARIGIASFIANDPAASSAGQGDE